MWTGEKLISSAATQKWRRITRLYWKKYLPEFLESIKDVPKPYNVKFTFVRQSKHRFDYVNPLETVLDEMVRQGWIADDNADEIKPHFGDYIYDKKHPGVYIKLITNKNELLE